MRIKPKDITAALAWCDKYIAAADQRQHNGSFYIYFLRAEDAVAYKLKFPT